MPGQVVDIPKYFNCVVEQVPAEEADILSKLLAEVASASEPNLLQEPALKVSVAWQHCSSFLLL